MHKQIKKLVLLLLLFFVPQLSAIAATSEYLSPYFFIFAFIPFFVLGPLGVFTGLYFSKEKSTVLKISNSTVGVILGYLFSYGLICVFELLQL
jgi:hypothetical protein